MYHVAINQISSAASHLSKQPSGISQHYIFPKCYASGQESFRIQTSKSDNGMAFEPDSIVF